MFKKQTNKQKSPKQQRLWNKWMLQRAWRQLKKKKNSVIALWSSVNFTHRFWDHGVKLHRAQCVTPTTVRNLLGHRFAERSTSQVAVCWFRGESCSHSSGKVLLFVDNSLGGTSRSKFLDEQSYCHTAFPTGKWWRQGFFRRFAQQKEIVVCHLSVVSSDATSL